MMLKCGGHLLFVYSVSDPHFPPLPEDAQSLFFFSANFFACSNFVVSVETSTSFHDSYTPTTAPYRPQIIDWS